MSITFQSSSPVAWDTSGGNLSVTITKPTGLAEGDLMVAPLLTGGVGGTPTGAPTLSGWTQLSVSTQIEEVKLYTLYKIADSSDVASSNFTFTATYNGVGTAKLGGAILRMDGFASTTTPDEDTGFDNNKNNTSVSITGMSMTPSYDNSLLVLFLAGGNNEVGEITFSNISAGKSLTWTSRASGTETLSDDASIEIFTAPFASASEITSITATASAAQDDYIAIINAFAPQVDDSATLDVATLTGAPETLSPSGNANASLDAATLTATAEDVTAATPDPKWTNTQKSDTSPTITNTQKS